MGHARGRIQHGRALLINLVWVLHDLPELGDFHVLMLFKQVGSIHGLVSQQRKLALQCLHHLRIALRMKRVLTEHIRRAVPLQRLGSRTEAIARNIAVPAENRITQARALEHFPHDLNHVIQRLAFPLRMSGDPLQRHPGQSPITQERVQQGEGFLQRFSQLAIR